jgi:hypothetical protein
MKRVLTLFVVLGLMACGTAQAQPPNVIDPCIECGDRPNLLENPSFEDIAVPTPPDPVDPLNAADWSEFSSLPGSTSTRQEIMPRTGMAHMVLEAVGANQFAGVFQGNTAAVNPGQIVTISGWHKWVIGSATRELKLEWVGAPQTRVDTIEVGPMADYEEFCLTAIAPAGTTGVTATYAISTFGPGMTEALVYLDDMTLCIIPEPASVMLGLIGVLGCVGLVRRR